MEDKEIIIDFTPDADRFRGITEKMVDIFIRKNHDYGNSFSETVQELGLLAGYSSIRHKCNRLKSILKGGEIMVKDETVRDSLLDMANYCIMLAMEIDKQNEER